MQPSDVSWGERFEVWAYPIAVISDRYGGVYSGGKWIAVAGLSRGGMGEAVLKMLSYEGDIERDLSPWGSDTCAGDFWCDPPKWIAVGDTPEQAINALKAKNRGADGSLDGEKG
jgi:hypothetical protein